MACSKQAGVAPFLHVIEVATGEKVTQSEWHAIRALAAEASGEDLSRARVPSDEAINALDDLQWSNAKLVEGDEELERNHSVAVIAASTDIWRSNVTKGTVLAVSYLAEYGAAEVLTRVREKGNAGGVRQEKSQDELSAQEDWSAAAERAAETGRRSDKAAEEKAYGRLVRVQDKANETPAEYADREWASEVYWPNVPVEEREAFAWAMESNVVKFYGPSYSENANDYNDYADIDMAGEVSHALHTAQNDLDESVTINRLATETQLRESMYLAEDGDKSPAEQVWEEWKANGVPTVVERTLYGAEEV